MQVGVRVRHAVYHHCRPQSSQLLRLPALSLAAREFSKRCVEDGVCHELAVANRGRGRPHCAGNELITLLIDGDQFPRCALRIVAAVRPLGKIVRAQIFMEDWRAESLARGELRDAGVDVVLGSAAMGIKRAAIEAESATMIALATGHKSLSEEVFATARARAQRTCAVVALRGFVEFTPRMHAHLPWVDEIKYFTAQCGMENREKAPPRRGMTMEPDGSFSFVVPRDQQAAELAANVPMTGEKYAQVFDLLSSLGYLPIQPPADVWQVIGGAAKFTVVHKLWPMMLSPLADMIRQLHGRISDASSCSWTRNPGTLAFMVPWRNGPTKQMKDDLGSFHAYIEAGGGPFIEVICPDLVTTVLHRLAYLTPGEELDVETLQLFASVASNAKRLQAAGVDPDQLTKESLHAAFANQDIVQRWKCAPRDSTARSFLLRRRQISSWYAEPCKMMEAMGSFLSSVQPGTILPATYAGRTSSLLEYLDRGNNRSRRS